MAGFYHAIITISSIDRACARQYPVLPRHHVSGYPAGSNRRLPCIARYMGCNGQIHGGFIQRYSVLRCSNIVHVLPHRCRDSITIDAVLLFFDCSNVRRIYVSYCRAIHSGRVVVRFAGRRLFRPGQDRGFNFMFFIVFVPVVVIAVPGCTVFSKQRHDLGGANPPDFFDFSIPAKRAIFDSDRQHQGP